MNTIATNQPEAVSWPGPARSPDANLLEPAAITQLRAARGAVRLGLGPQRTVRVADTARRAAFLLDEDAFLLGVGPRVVSRSPGVQAE